MTRTAPSGKGRKNTPTEPEAVNRRLDREPSNGREFFRTLFRKSAHGICVTGLDRKIVIANREAERLTGYGESELTGRPITDIYAEKKDPVPELLDLLGREGTASASLRLRKNTRGDLPVRIRYLLVRGLIGGDFIVETYSDLSERLRFDRLRNEFVFVAAHELRNPVTAIRLLLDIIFDDRRVSLDPLLRDYLLKLQEANDRLTQLVDDLLEVSRTESDRLKIHATEQDIEEHVRRVMGDMRPTAVSKGLSIRYSPEGPVPKIMADPMKLDEILSNLISNAVKYNITGGKVTITHKIRGKTLHTSISDSGIGISAEDQRRLFEKFWRSDDLAVRAQAGTGLGLFIVRELVRRMGGDITAKSRRGEGSTFTFSLPIA